LDFANVVRAAVHGQSQWSDRQAIVRKYGFVVANFQRFQFTQGLQKKIPKNSQHGSSSHGMRGAPALHAAVALIWPLLLFNYVIDVAGQ
jgi:hypothetical protein